MRSRKIIISGSQLMLYTRDDDGEVVRKSLGDIRLLQGWKVIERAIRLKPWTDDQVKMAAQQMSIHRRAEDVKSKTLAACIGCNWNGQSTDFNRHVAKAMDHAARRVIR